KTGSDETEPTNEKFPNLIKEYWNDEDETAEIFKIETNIFNEPPLCMAFNEFNYLFKVDPELFTYDIERTENYDNYMNEFNDAFEEPWDEDGVPYEIGDHIYEPFRFKNERTKWPTCSTNEDGFYNGGELPGMVRVSYMTYFQDHEWDDEEYVAIKENENDDLTNTSEDACRAYQEIFRKLDEGWMVTRME
ncbi:hypothetical protein Tco_1478352, partial [Tanacetum coccineum]